MNGDDYYRRRALKRLAIIVGCVVIAGAAIWFIARSGSFSHIASFTTSDGQLVQEDTAKNFSAPEPLVVTTTANEYTLTRAGVIADTNEQRAENGNLLPLAENTTLDEVATLRLNDMFTKQYFAHVSPSSSSAITVADSLGYAYIDLGENLALGNFDGNEGVVTAWMNSPGHRANILDTNYTQIGVAVGDGLFQGQEAWIAVQVFGRPASDCPAPDTSLQSTIEAIQAQIATLETQLQTDKAQIDQAQEEGMTNTAAYAQEVSSYDALVNQYNTLATQSQTEVAQYNAEAAVYNECVGAPASATGTATSSQ